MYSKKVYFTIILKIFIQNIMRRSFVVLWSLSVCIVGTIYIPVVVVRHVPHCQFRQVGTDCS